MKMVVKGNEKEWMGHKAIRKKINGEEREYVTGKEP